MIELSRNEMPYGPLPGVAEAVAEAAAGSHRYPDPDAAELTERIAAYNGVAPSRVTIGCGSVAILQDLVRVVCDPGDEVVFPWPSYRGYPAATRAAGAIGVPVPNTALHAVDLGKIGDAVTARTRMVIVCNPNNPTGTGIGGAALTAFAARVPEGVLLVLDEAYREFAPARLVADALAVVSERHNLVVTRTMSKAWSLAGLRVGYLVGPADLAAAVRKASTPYGTSSVAQAAAMAALEAKGEMLRRCGVVTAERERVATRLASILPGIPPSWANFVWLPLGDRSSSFASGCRDRGVEVCELSPYGVRVSIGDPRSNDAFLDAAASLLNHVSA